MTEFLLDVPSKTLLYIPAEYKLVQHIICTGIRFVFQIFYKLFQQSLTLKINNKRKI